MTNIKVALDHDAQIGGEERLYRFSTVTMGLQSFWSPPLLCDLPVAVY